MASLTCRRFLPTTPKPMVSMPAMSKFGTILTLSLKEVKIGPCKYIFHMIDGFTCYIVSVFLIRQEGRDYCQRHDEQLDGQLVLGKQPKLPNVMEDKLPVLEGVTTSKSLVTHITVMHAGRKAFTEAL